MKLETALFDGYINVVFDMTYTYRLELRLHIDYGSDQKKEKVKD